MRFGYLVGCEQECLTVATGRRASSEPLLPTSPFFHAIRQLVPHLPGANGLFTPYGRIYLDGAHLELATAECASPYQVPLLAEQLETIVARALFQSRETGGDWILASVNHDGVLRDDAHWWAAHENYLLRRSPVELAGPLLPFLATRTYTGAGGVHFPSGRFLANTRILALTRDTGGATTHARALHSTARDEPLVGQLAGYYRYHTLLGDGNRSHFSQALKVGTTLLVAHALCWKPERVESLPGTPAPHLEQRAFWMRAVRHFNVLAECGAAPRVAPMALRVQRFYLELVLRFLEEQPEQPAWCQRLVDDWEGTLGALAAKDDAWLARRLDPWIKHRLFTAVLRERGHGWHDLASHRALYDELALLNQNYHEFAHPNSVFSRLEAAGAVDHRVAERQPIGHEPEPFVPDLGTRAVARARFLKAHSGDESLVMDWDAVRDRQGGVRASFQEPFAQTGP